MYNKKRTLEVDRSAIWHPYTPMKDYAERDPLVIVRAKGSKLYDADGKVYYDTISSWWCNVHGHCHPLINQAVQQQLKRLEHTLFAGITHPYAAELVDRLRAFLDPSLTRFFFSDNGSTAVEVALKMAFQYWQNQGVNNKTRFVFLENAYHGDTIGAMSVGGMELYHRLYAPLRFASFQAAAPQCRTCPHRQSSRTWDARSLGCSLQCFQAMEEILQKESTSIAAVIVEPLLQGSAGISFYPPAYLQALRELTTRLNVLLIFDEVATGFGRTGTFFAFQQAQTIPDLLCLSKGLSGGYLPLALTITREEIYQAFYADASAQKTFFHGHTYTANPLACAAGIASLKLFQQKRLPQSRSKVMHYFHQQLRAFDTWPAIGDIRYLGWIGAIDIISPKTRQPFPPEKRMGFNIYLESLKRGLFLRPLGDTIYWFLPLAITQKEVAEIMRRSQASIRAAITAAEADQ